MIVLGNTSRCKTHEDISRDAPMGKLGVYLEHLIQCVIPWWLGVGRHRS